VSAEALRGERIDGAQPPWRNPFVIAFVLGAIVLTVLPFIQRKTLRAPAPLANLGAWSLGGFGSENLHGKVWIAAFAPSPCDAECATALTRFGDATSHVNDLEIDLVVFAEAAPDARDVAEKSRAGASWRLLSGEPAAMDSLWNSFAQSWEKQMQTVTDRKVEFLARPTLAVIDQDGAVRGLWPADDEGRGLAITAARMFARYGTEP